MKYADSSKLRATSSPASVMACLTRIAVTYSLLTSKSSLRSLVSVREAREKERDGERRGRGGVEVYEREEM